MADYFFETYKDFPEAVLKAGYHSIHVRYGIAKGINPKHEGTAAIIEAHDGKEMKEESLADIEKEALAKLETEVKEVTKRGKRTAKLESGEDPEGKPKQGKKVDQEFLDFSSKEQPKKDGD